MVRTIEVNYDAFLEVVDLPEHGWDVEINGFLSSWKRRHNKTGLMHEAISWGHSDASREYGIRWGLDSGICRSNFNDIFAAFLVKQDGWSQGMIVQFWSKGVMLREVDVTRLKPLLPENAESNGAGHYGLRIWWDVDKTRKIRSDIASEVH